MSYICGTLSSSVTVCIPSWNSPAFWWLFKVCLQSSSLFVKHINPMGMTNAWNHPCTNQPRTVWKSCFNLNILNNILWRHYTASLVRNNPGHSFGRNPTSNQASMTCLAEDEIKELRMTYYLYNP